MLGHIYGCWAIGFRILRFGVFLFKGVALDLGVYSGCEALGLVSLFYCKKGFGYCLLFFFGFNGPWGILGFVRLGGLNCCCQGIAWSRNTTS